MPKNPTGEDSVHARRRDAGWEAAPAQGTLHMRRAGVRAGILQGHSQAGKGRRSRRKGLRGLELPRCESTAGEGTHSSPRTVAGGPAGTPQPSKSKLGFPLALSVISTEHRLFIRNLFPLQSILNSMNRDQV